MKFKKLTITNIGSIENKTIDFTANPLGSASLFLISGPTGSGKSIILDSICLALYGKAVRLEKVSNRESYLDPEFNCTADGSISLSDSRQLYAEVQPMHVQALFSTGMTGMSTLHHGLPHVARSRN